MQRTNWLPWFGCDGDTVRFQQLSGLFVTVPEGTAFPTLGNRKGLCMGKDFCFMVQDVYGDRSRKERMKRLLPSPASCLMTCLKNDIEPLLQVRGFPEGMEIS